MNLIVNCTFCDTPWNELPNELQNHSRLNQFNKSLINNWEGSSYRVYTLYSYMLLVLCVYCEHYIYLIYYMLYCMVIIDWHFALFISACVVLCWIKKKIMNILLFVHRCFVEGGYRNGRRPCVWISFQIITYEWKVVCLFDTSYRIISIFEITK